MCTLSPGGKKNLFTCNKTEDQKEYGLSKITEKIGSGIKVDLGTEYQVFHLHLNHRFSCFPLSLS